MNPQTFGRFNIVRRLPAGGMGRVYEAVDAGNSRRVALKLIDRGPDPDSMQIVAAERLGVELHQRLCAIDPRVTAVFEFGDTPEFFYIVMEYVEGRDLSELAAEERLGHPFAARIAQDVLEVLSHAHGFRTSFDGREYQGIVHGDIKPRNIRLTTAGQTKVLDFGIAKALSMTRNFTQNMFGSVQYSSPERLNTGEVTIGSDLWSVAVVLYEMVARRPYFQAESAHKLDHVIRGYRELRPLPEDCPEPLKQILTRALSPDPALRYPSAAGFAADLNAFRNGEPSVGEETVRTFAAGPGSGFHLPSDTSETVRTSSNVGETVAAPVPIARQPKKSGIRWGRIFLLAFLGACLFVAYLFVHEWNVYKDARALAHDIESERVRKLDAAWDNYRAIADRANMGASLWGVQNAMRDRLMAEADRPINEYRVSDAPMVTEGEWVRARQHAARALELKPGDASVRGKLRLIDGHLSRIRGAFRGDAKMLQDAREKFTEAASLLPKSPDPWLGLERLFVYALHDVDRGEAAVKEAERRGQDVGKRETALLADGFRDRAERTLKEALQANNRPQQERYLDLAKKDFNRARELYESIIPWGAAAVNLRKAYEGLERIEILRSHPAESRKED